MIRKLNDSLYVTKKVTSNEGKACTGQNTVILPNFMVGKFVETQNRLNAQNSAETKRLHVIFAPGN